MTRPQKKIYKNAIERTEKSPLTRVNLLHRLASSGLFDMGQDQLKTSLEGQFLPLEETSGKIPIIQKILELSAGKSAIIFYKVCAR
jgi:hypothetical protein